MSETTTTIASTHLTNDEVNKLIDAMRDTPPATETGATPPDDDPGNGGGGDKDLTLHIYIRGFPLLVIPRVTGYAWNCDCVDEDSGSHQPAMLQVDHVSSDGGEVATYVVAENVVAVSEVW